MLCSSDKKKQKSTLKKGHMKWNKKNREPSQCDFPTFLMPTESEKKRKLIEVEQDKREKEKSDQDDTLEKIESLRIEKSDKTKRSARKKILG